MAKRKKHQHKVLKRTGLLVILLAIAEGLRKGKDLEKAYDWGKNKTREYLGELEKAGYIVKAKATGLGRSVTYQLTEKGRKELPALAKEVAHETKDFLGEVRESAAKHLGAMIPELEITFSVAKGRKKTSAKKKTTKKAPAKKATTRKKK